eukprot:g68949.t1
MWCVACEATSVSNSMSVASSSSTRVVTITFGTQEFRFKIRDSVASQDIEKTIRARFGIAADERLLLTDMEEHAVIIDHALCAAHYHLHTAPCPQLVPRPLRLGERAPNFLAESSQGQVELYSHVRGSWALLLWHPKDFLPVSSTELGRTAQLVDEWKARNTKVVAVSQDTIANHRRWIKEINAFTMSKMRFPLVADPACKIGQLFGLDVHGVERHVLVIRPDLHIALHWTYPAQVGLSFDEVLRALDALQLAEACSVATPVDWRPDHPVLLPADMSTSLANQRFKQVQEFFPYLRCARNPLQCTTLTSLLASPERDYLLSNQSPSQQTSLSSLQGSIVALYFGAHWCRPCHPFESLLRNACVQLEQAGQAFKVVYISRDYSQEQFDASFAQQRWLALPFSARDLCEEICQRFKVFGYPALVILDEEGDLLTCRGRELLVEYGSAAFPFSKIHIEDLKQRQNEKMHRLPRHAKDYRHEHKLTLLPSVRDRSYGCDSCHLPGLGWCYHCVECNDYDVHPGCIALHEVSAGAGEAGQRSSSSEKHQDLEESSKEEESSEDEEEDSSEEESSEEESSEDEEEQEESSEGGFELP